VGVFSCSFIIGEGVKFMDAPTRTRQREPLNDLWGMGGENNSAPLF
jgi:hypothetical protein